MLFMFIKSIIKIRSYLSRWFQASESGQGLIEYALIILLIVVGVILILGLVGGQIQTLYQKIINGLP